MAEEGSILAALVTCLDAQLYPQKDHGYAWIVTAACTHATTTRETNGTTGTVCGRAESTACP